MRELNKFLMLFILVFFTALTFAQTSVNGTVTADDGSALPGVTVMVKGTTVGTVTDANGKYKIEAPAGAQFLVFSYIGMTNREVALKAGTIDVVMMPENAELVEIFVVADRAKERETPVAFSDVDKKEIEQQLGSRDIPLIMNQTPSVYATASGGGAGDARINVRGFNQRNVAIMLNGVPINDMENGWVYWSNWDGIADATSSIQMQRGLSAVNLATPSVGGTMNIITSPADKKAGGSAKLEYGSGNFMKMSLSGNTGLINDKFALSVALVGKQGDGVIDQTWTKAWAYYMGATYKINKNHKVELFAMGAPQRHGQNLYKQNLATYGADVAQEFGADSALANKFVPQDRYYNQNWAPVSNYNADQYWNGKTHKRYDASFINTRENFYHKPLVNMNWYATWTEKIKQYTTLYYSGGTGGGTGTYGAIYRRDAEGNLGDDDYKFYYGKSPWTYDLNEMVSVNSGSLDTVYIDRTPYAREAGQSVGILRNSRNNQNTIGAISRVQFLLSDKLKAQIGIDWRTAKIEHYREIRDLLGGDFYYFDGDEFDTSDHHKVLGDKVDYNFTNTVDWFGYFAQAEYNTSKFTAYATFGNSFIKYTYTNHFRKGSDGNELKLTSESLPGYQIKGGISYRPIGGFSVFANYGYISKAPVFDNVISDDIGQFVDNPDNEIFNAYEFGINYQTPSKNMDVKVNYYNTTWENRALNYRTEDQDRNDINMFISGIDQLHKGFEFEGNYHPVKYLSIGAMASFGNWEYTNDVSGRFKYYNETAATDTTYSIYTNGLKIGDAPQTQFGGMLTVVPINGLRIQFDMRHYSNFYADWNPFTRTDENDVAQVWLTPAYTIADLHLSYVLPLKGKTGVEVFGHIFNLFDELYIQDAVDNSKYNGYYGYDHNLSHDANTAEVFLGLPRTFNAGIKITF